MRTFLRTLAVVLVLLLSSSAFAASPGPIGLEIEVQPVDNLEDGFVCKARVVDLAGDSLMAAPQLVFSPMETGSTVTTLPGGTKVELQVEIKPERPDKLSYRVEVHSASAELLGRHVGSVSF